MSVVADVRTTQIRTSVEVEAPREGGGSRRINCMVRQLGAAPDTLTVEVLFARREQTCSEQLKDVRANPAALLPEPSAEVRAFRLTPAVPMGTRRNGLRKASVPSVNDAVEAVLRPRRARPRPTPPKMPTEAAAEAIDAVDRAVDA